MNVRRTPQAERDRLAIWEYIAARNPGAAVRIDRLFSEAAAGLRDLHAEVTKVRWRGRES